MELFSLCLSKDKHSVLCTFLATVQNRRRTIFQIDYFSPSLKFLHFLFFPLS